MISLCSRIPGWYLIWHTPIIIIQLNITLLYMFNPTKHCCHKYNPFIHLYWHLNYIYIHVHNMNNTTHITTLHITQTLILTLRTALLPTAHDPDTSFNHFVNTYAYVHILTYNIYNTTWITQLTLTNTPNDNTLLNDIYASIQWLLFSASVSTIHPIHIYSTDVHNIFSITQNNPAIGFPNRSYISRSIRFTNVTHILYADNSGVWWQRLTGSTCGFSFSTPDPQLYTYIIQCFCMTPCHTIETIPVGHMASIIRKSHPETHSRPLCIAYLYA
jgi:hypothetical protein